MPMVSYWKTQDKAAARVITLEDGSLGMHIEGEKYPFPGFPRGHSLFGSLSPLKHQIKNQVFNDAWAKLEAGEPHDKIIKEIKETFRTGLTEFWEDVKYDSIPPEKFSPAVKEIWRTLTVLEPESKLIKPIKEMLCFILQEDDAYRFRAEDMFEYFNPNVWWKRIYRFITRKKYIDSIKLDFDFALSIIEHCEVIGDMKERQRLLRRILMLLLEDKRIAMLFEKFCKELNWKKVFLTKADRYHFRGKYYKVDYRLFDY